MAAILSMTISLMIAAPASAGIQSIQWSGQAHTGTDAFYEQDVAAFAADSTATLAVLVQNTAGTDVAIKSAKIDIGGIGEFTTTDFPASISKGESDFVNFSFTVPSTASNSVLYNYTVHIRYDQTDDNEQGIEVNNAFVGQGDGVTTVFYLANTPIVPNSITIEVPPGTATTAYTLEEETGKITFTTAPDNGDNIMATEYRYYPSWTQAGTNFAVYSSGQSTAQNLNQQLESFDYADFAGVLHGVPAGTRALLAQAAEEETLGDQDYAAGDFAAANTHYQAALDFVDQAMESDQDLVKEDLSLPSAAVWVAGAGVLLFGLGILIFSFRWRVVKYPRP